MQAQTVSRALVELPQRRKGNFSKAFRTQKLVTNHYTVDVAKFDKIYIFSLRFTPMIPADNKQLRNSIIDQALPTIKQFVTNPVVSGMNIFTVVEPKETTREITIDQYTLNVKQVKVFNIKENEKMLLTFLNNGLRNIMNKLDYVEIGRSGKYFNGKEKQQIDNLMMYNGFKSNFVSLQKGIFLRVDSAKKIVRNQTVLQFIDEFYKKHTDKDKAEKRNLLKAELVNSIIMTNYGKTRYQKIEDIVFAELEQYFLDEAKTVNIKNYYQSKYSITIKSMKQPLLEVQNKRGDNKTLLVPQLCLMTGIPDDFDEMRRKKISEQTIKGPQEKINQIGGLMKKLKDTTQISSLRQLGLNVHKEMTNFNAKIVPTPTLTLGKNNTVDKGKQAFFNLFNKPIFASKHNLVCGLIYYKGTDIRVLNNTFESTAKNLGTDVKMKLMEITDGNKRPEKIEDYISKAIDSQCNICCIVIPGNMKNHYKRIKEFTLTKEQIVTQVVTDAKCRNKNVQSIATKILLQMLAKRGNILWVPQGKADISQTMLLAFDTAKVHNSTLLAACATNNSTFSNVYSCTKIFENPNDKFNTMRDLMIQCIGAYVTRNKSPPKDVVVFLNSCSGDQISIYHENYINPVKEKLREIYKDKQVNMTIIMLNLKVNERFFIQQGQVKNPPAGTLVAQEMVSANYDFYLISQMSTKGSTVPNHYKVIYTDSELEEGELQELAFGQCFNYVNWQGSIKVPAILQYAKKCAKFNSEVMEKKVVPDGLQTKLYFV